ncbi:ABC transporter G family member 23 isoform X2 [Halyomorpha halys]|nr:ABC transporter G family member 23-like isoform X2 [Halyomorpha halys]XP_014283821.1 ABC transporter G family member 23-like isoform X2 [Halyomorpha halys]XP_024217533.1 ABC transporter G family member 23-like isoform X2 [Halyomorpha halys]
MDGDGEENMIEVRGAYKRFDEKTEVLRDLNMTVERGTVYAFLGPSGCGKTTLLKCIVGRMRLDAGEIILGIQRKSQIGYMPQDTALLLEITIKETLSYFGWMYGLKGRDLERRKQELYSFLDMPLENIQIKKLSGGERRRVSLCVALLNNPDLMILDEPTVGVDPLLSYSIWQCLLNMSNRSNKTVLLTTHYIEEARKANKVGMMRRGCLLVEEKATTIMEEYNCNTLEHAFIKLSTQQETIINNNEDEKNYPVPVVKPKVPLAENNFFSLSNFISILLKNMYFLKYSPLGWFLMLFVPISASILFQFAVGKEKFELKFGLVNEELGHDSCDNFNSTCKLASCEYINLLQENHLDLVIYQDIRNAHSDARRNLIWGYLYLPHNFTQSLYKRIVEKGFVDNETLTDSEISVWIDMSNQVMGNHLKKNIYLSFTEFLNQLSLSCKWPVENSWNHIRFNRPIYGFPDPNYNESSIVGMLLMLEFFLPMTYASALLDDKVEGILERSFIAGHTPAELVAAQVFVTTILFIIATTLLTTIFYGIFNHTFEGNIILGMVILFFVGLSGIFFGISVALMFDSLTSATVFILGTFLPITVLSGMIWPTEAMDSSLRSISFLLPLTHATEAYRSIAYRSWTINHPVIYVGFLSSLLWASIFCLTTIFLVKTKPGIAVK